MNNVRWSREGRPAVLLSLTTMLGACGLGSAQLRLDGGALRPCDSGPHCVSSTSEQARHAIAPIEFTGSREQAMQRLLAVLGSTPRLQLVITTPDYVLAEASTPIMRYVDDVEWLFHPSLPLIDVRSSSRIGYYDFQANRERIEDIRRRFAAT